MFLSTNAPEPRFYREPASFWLPGVLLPEDYVEYYIADAMEDAFKTPGAAWMRGLQAAGPGDAVLPAAVPSGASRFGARTLQRHDELNRFFAGIERRALRIAEIGVRNRDDALDIVQDSMIRLAERYGKRDASEWPPLFYRILQNKVRDFHRRGAVRNRVIAWFGGGDDDRDPVADLPDPGGRSPEQSVGSGDAMQALAQAMRELPARQREAFELRALEGFGVRDTAAAMGVSEGSVKTHYSRAVHTLRDRLGDHWQ